MKVLEFKPKELLNCNSVEKALNLVNVNYQKMEALESEISSLSDTADVSEHIQSLKSLGDRITNITKLIKDKQTLKKTG